MNKDERIEEWKASFRDAELAAFRAGLESTPSQRLEWLEEAVIFAYRVGALPRDDDPRR